MKIALLLLLPVLAFGTVEFSPNDLTSNTSHPPYVSSASSEFSASFAPWKVFDVTGGYWIGTGSGVDWVKLDLGGGIRATMSSYTITVNSVPEPLRAPRNWTMEGSNDNSAWTVVDTQTNQIAWLLGETRTYTLGSTSSPFRYYRINITANNGDATYTQIAKLRLIGDFVPSVGSSHGMIL